MTRGTTKITLIGAGSVEFGRTLIGDVLSYESLNGATISLMDTDAHRLDLISRLAKRMVAQAGRDIEVISTTKREDSLGDADYVITTIHAGGLEAYEKDIEIPMKYGVDQCIGDTLGPGGIMRAARNIPILVDIAHDMERLCPSAVLLNYSNPMAMNVRAIGESTNVHVFGLCHSIPNTAERLAGFIGAALDEIDYWAAGINHMTWFLRFHWKGKDAYPLLREAMKRPEIYGADPIRFDLMKSFGYFVAESSGHASEYYPYFRKRRELVERFVKSYTADDAYWHDWGRSGGYLRYSRDETDELDETISRQISGADKISIERSGEYSIQIIDSIETGAVRRVHANVINHGLISNLPEDCCVEVPSLVDKGGLHPCRVGELPSPLAALCRSNINVQEVTVKACLNEDRDMLKRAFALDPLTAAVLTLDEIEKMADELLNAESKWLPKYLTG